VLWQEQLSRGGCHYFPYRCWARTRGAGEVECALSKIPQGHEGFLKLPSSEADRIRCDQRHFEASSCLWQADREWRSHRRNMHMSASGKHRAGFGSWEGHPLPAKDLADPCGHLHCAIEFVAGLERSHNRRQQQRQRQAIELVAIACGYSVVPREKQAGIGIMSPHLPSPNLPHRSVPGAFGPCC